MTTEERKRLSKQPIVWKGDLSDDCTAEWAGLMLRAEWMDEDYWWWAVYDMQKGEITIDSSNEHPERYVGGEVARQQAESVAVGYIAVIASEITAKYLIADTFRITGRGLVLVGYIMEGLVSFSDTIEFTANDTLRQRRILGIAGMRKTPPDEVNTAMLIQCINEVEIEELRNWQPDKTEAIIYKTSNA